MTTTTTSKFNHIKSISLPRRSHATTRKVEEAINNLKTLKISNESKIETMHDGLLGLEELYKRVNDLLNLPQTLQFFSQHQHEKWVKDLLDKSMRLLDVCGTARELVLQCKENVRYLQFALRRSKGGSTTEAIMIRFASSCKKIKKEAKKLVLVQRKLDQETESVFNEVDYVLFNEPLTDGSNITTGSNTVVVDDIAKMKFEKDNKTVRGHLLNYMTNHLFDLFVTYKSAKEICDSLEKKYGTDDAGKKKYVVGQWIKFQMVDNNSIMEQFHEYENLTADVLNERMKLCEILQANVLLEKFLPS
ncbi:putative B3 domain-containing transcription factor VRN1-like [Capsicum annuum]|nr:putative B3 domain-containing transcription factor VRN1-like [Capsicum annuum]